MSKNTVETTIRFNLSKEDDLKAWEYLHSRDEKQYKSYSRAVIIAVNGYFDRQKRLENDPYLETREKEDAFLRQVSETIETALRKNTAASTLTELLNALQQPSVQPEESAESEETISAALDFADSL